ncbi:MAG: arginase family protein [Candidatus Heimdallarchaeaceae archaeon]
MKNTLVGFFPLNSVNKIKEKCVLLFGIPFEGKKETKKGARKAPKEIRKVSQQFSGISSNFNINTFSIPCYDLGDFHPIKEWGEINEVWVKAEKTSSRIIVLGGDHLISYYTLAEAPWDDKTALIWLDAHADLAKEYPHKIIRSHATVFFNLHEEGKVSLEQMLFIGGHGYTQSNDEFEFIENKSITHIPTYKIHNALQEALQTLTEFVEKFDKIYLSIDIDVLDQSFVPTVGCPEPFGINPSILMKIIEKILPKCVYVDIVEARSTFKNKDVLKLVVALIFNILKQWEEE